MEQTPDDLKSDDYVRGIHQMLRVVVLLLVVIAVFAFLSYQELQQLTDAI